MPLVLNQLKRVDTKQICASVGQCSDDQDATALKFESVSDGNTSMHGKYSVYKKKRKLDVPVDIKSHLKDKHLKLAGHLDWTVTYQ